MIVGQGRRMAHRAGRRDRLERIANRAVRDAAAPLALARGVPSRAGLPAGRSRLLAVAAVALVALTALPALAGSGGHPASALDALATGPAVSAVSAVPADSSAQSAAAAAASAPAPTLDPLGGMAGLNPIDLVAKALLVLGLLYLTLTVLRRLQGGQATGSSRLGVLETRPLGPKASIHLVAVGDRRLVVGLTPGGMVALAELDASELPVATGSATPSATTRPAPTPSALSAASAAGSVFASATSLVANRLPTVIHVTRRGARPPEDLR